MLKAQGEIDVILDANGAPVMRAIDNVVKRVNDIKSIVTQIEKKAAAAAKAFDIQPKIEQFDRVLRQLEGFEKRLLSAGRQPISRAAGDAAFAGQIRRASTFQRQLKDANTSAQAFEARLSTIDRKLVTLGNSGRIDNRLMSKRLGLEQAERDFKSIQREIAKTDAAFERLGKSGNRSRLNSAENSLFGALRNGRRTNFSAELAEYRAAWRDYQLQLRKIRSEGSGGGGGGGIFGNAGLGGVFLRTAAYGAAAAAIYGVVSALKDGVTASLEFNDQLTKISAVAGLTQTQQEDLGQTIRDVGANSRYATNEIAEATMVLAQAGFTSKEIADSLQAVNNLAAASGVSFSEATDVITSAVGAFQLNASETARITDVLASALNNTKLNIQQVALGIQYAGQTAYEQNISFEELTAVMATMAQAGIRSGSTIGTGLRQFLVDLQAPTAKLTAKLTDLGLTMADIDVKTLGLPEVLNRLAKAGFDASEAYSSIEKRAAAAYIVLKNNRDLLQKQIIAQNQIGLAADGAARGMDSLTAQWQRYKNQLNESVDNGIKPTTNALKDFFKTINDQRSDRTLQELVKNVNDAGFALDGGGQLRDAKEKLREYTEAAAQTRDIISEMSPVLEEARTRVNESTDAFSAQQQTIESVTQSLATIILRKNQLQSSEIALQAETASLTSRFAGLAAQLYGTASSYDNLILAMQRYRKEAIAIGALRAQEQGFTLKNQAIQQGKTADKFGNALRQNGGFERLPKNVQQAFLSLNRNPRDLVAQRVVYDYANSEEGRNSLNGQQQFQLRSFATYAARAGSSSAAAKEAFNQRDVYSQFGSKRGQEELGKLDNLSGKSNAEIQAQLKVWAQKAGDPKNSPSVRAAYGALVQQGEAYLGSGNAPQAKTTSSSGKRSATDRAEREEDRRQMQIARQRIKASNAELDDAVKNLTREGGPSTLDENGDVVVSGSRGLTKAKILSNLKKADDSLEKWVSDRLDLMNAEIDSGNLTGEEAQLFRDEVMREIEAKRGETNRAIMEGLVKAMESQVATIEKIQEAAEKAAEHVLATAEGRLSSLDRFNLRGRVPDFVKNHYSRQVAEARDVRDQAQIGINDRTIESLQKKLSRWRDLLEEIRASKNVQDIYILNTAIDDLETKMNDLVAKNEELKVSFGGEALLPQNFSQALALAIEDFREANNLRATFMESLQGEFPSILQGASDGITQFFTDIMTGTRTVKDAFRGFVRSMIQLIAQLIAKLIALQIIKTFLSFLPGGGGGGVGGNGIGSLGGTPSFSGYVGIGSSGAFHGGPVRNRAFHGAHVGGSAFNGDYVNRGHVGRDSTYYNVAKGEYIVRKPAVDSVGVGFMRRLNERGKAALPQGLEVQRGNVSQKTNVYIIKPDEKPQMGPNDVIVAIQDDILKDGQTKKLIRAVAQEHKVATWTFCPNGLVVVAMPPEQTSVVNYNGWAFSAKPKVPYQYGFDVTLHGLAWYLQSNGLFDKTTNPTVNAALFQDFIRQHGVWKSFVFPHPHLGDINARFRNLPKVPEGMVNSYGLIEAFNVELVHHNPSYTQYE